MTRAELLEAVAAHTKRRRVVEREMDAKVADVVISQVLKLVWPYVKDSWEGEALLRELRNLGRESAQTRRQQQ